MLKLLFVLSKFPRTIGRKEWKEIWRWKRVTEKELKKHEAEMLERMRNFAAFGTTHPEMYQDMIERIINPPITFHDKQEFWK